MDDFEAARMARRALADVRHGIEVFGASLEILEREMPSARRNAEEALGEFADAVARSDRRDTAGAVRMLGTVHPPLVQEWNAVRAGMAEPAALKKKTQDAASDLRTAVAEVARIEEARGLLTGLGLSGTTPSEVLDGLNGRGGMRWTWGLITGRSAPLEKAIAAHPKGFAGLQQAARTAALEHPDTEPLQARVRECVKAEHQAPRPDLGAWRAAFSRAVTLRVRVDPDDTMVGVLAAYIGTSDEVLGRAVHPQRLQELRRLFERQIDSLKRAEEWLERALEPRVMQASTVKALPYMAGKVEPFGRMLPYTRGDLSPSVLAERLKPSKKDSPSAASPERETSAPGAGRR